MANHSGSCLENPVDSSMARNISGTRLISDHYLLVAQTVKNPPAMRDTWVRSLGWEDPLEEAWQPTPVFSPGESHAQRSLAAYSSWSPERLSTGFINAHFSLALGSPLEILALLAKVSFLFRRYNWSTVNDQRSDLQTIFFTSCIKLGVPLILSCHFFFNTTW